jgi:F-type H+-transporting ATPase subunit b
MPQFELSNFVPQIAWLAIFFAILYFGIVRLTLPKIGRVVDDREAKVTGDLSAAEAAKANADMIEAAYHADIAEAQAKARAAVAEARGKAAKATEAKLAAADAAADAKIVEAQARIDKARDEASASIEAIAADAAADIVERLTGKRPDGTVAAKAARAAIAG